ncbi:hypothetical protein BLS_000422 [Venturia inaequalis]|uniref:Uncharacterized protein n=1 Tax=Venturia inaequalis TaxID=5025 RepID=A0A8H3UF00_VENIN|nr:hypothetical protein BLS_000422 [Venturia inaequalis]KAE9968028.1 hypothetical protein EG327_011230 [Venturia inaequalis]RDI79736.1 hypothetical protein Vi05172_g10257 [Venturia inaequalis]
MKIPTTLALAVLPFLITAQQQKGWLFETSSGRAQGIGSRSCQRYYLKKSENWTLKLGPMKKSRKVRSASPEPQSGWGEAGWGNGNVLPPPPTGGGWGDGPVQDGGWGNTPLQDGGGTWNPVANPTGWTPPPDLPPSNNGLPPSTSGGGAPSWTPPTPNQPEPNRPPPPPQTENKPPPSNNKPPPQDTNGGTWYGPKGPPANNGGRPPQNNGGQWNGPTSAKPSTLKCCVKMYLDDDCKDSHDEGCVVDKNDKRTDKGKASKDSKSFNVVCS